VSRSCDWVLPALSAVLLIFSFQFSLLFFHVGSLTDAAAYVVYPISDIGRCRKCRKYVSCTERTSQGKDFELILTVKWKLDISYGDHLVLNFRQSLLLCSYGGLKSQDLKIVSWQKNKISAASQTVATARIAPKICQGQLPTMWSLCSRFRPNRFIFGGVTAECVNIVYCPVEYFHDRLFEPITT